MYKCEKINQTVLLTGANGEIASQIREWTSKTFLHVKCLDKTPVEKKFINESVYTCDLANTNDLDNILENTDTIIHLAAQSTDTDWLSIKNDNIDAMHNLFLSCLRSVRKPRLIFASSAHVNGLEKVGNKVSNNSVVKPDSVYAVSKIFGENLAYLYHQKYDATTIVLRFGSVNDKPKTKRQHDHTWLGIDDTCQLIYLACNQISGFHVWYGVSAVVSPWWDQKNLENIGYIATNLVSNLSVFNEEPKYIYQGGDWANKK